MKCIKCGYDNDSFQTICQNCKAPLDSGLLMCPNCGKIIEEDNDTCPRCGNQIHVREIVKENIIIKEAYTPKYIVDDHLSMLTIIGIMIFMIWSLTYNIFTYIVDLIKIYNDEDLITQILLIFTVDIRLIVLIPLTILSIYTFLFRISINKVTTYDVMSNRLVILKCLLLADAVAFFTYFFVSFWPYTFDLDEEARPLIYYIGAAFGILQLIITLISLPLFYKKSKIRTR